MNWEDWFKGFNTGAASMLVIYQITKEIAKRFIKGENK